MEGGKFIEEPNGVKFQKLVGIEIKKVVKSLFEAIPLLGFSCGVGSSEKKKRENGE
jgi:hypothetical protein